MIEAVPNISEGRRPEVLDALSSALITSDGVLLLDASADPSHNRSVYTLAGDGAPLHAAIMRLVEVAVSRIDMRTHHGEHPRIGAVDVVPFIPLESSTMAECVDLARAVGRSIADAHGLPVYLYEEAAAQPERRRLEQVRRGQFEGLAERMRRQEWRPDFGPSTPHITAGATAVGARRPLIAFNVNLDTDDLAAARAIASAVRESSGGLPCVKAMGVWLAHRGVAQVSMNLTDFRRTPIEVAYGAVAREARLRGMNVLDSELIGLIPADALSGTTPERLKLANFDRARILEERIRQKQRDVRLKPDTTTGTAG
jgi:glutamate formiminotransferase